MADGRKLPAELISADPEADLAVLKLTGADSGTFPSLELGDSSELLIGEPVIAVGNPLGFSHSVSTGIVSAVHGDLKDAQDRVLLGDLIQADAAINRGNSGGPLLNAYAQVIGINTAVRGDAQNIGFAIQVNKLRDMIPDLMNPAHVKKVDVPLKLRERRAAEPPARVSATVELASESAATTVTEINGKTSRSIIDAYAILLKLKVNDDIVLKLAGERVVRYKAQAVPLPDALVQARQRLGLVVEPLTPMLAQKYGLLNEDGLLVSEVMRDTPGSRAGIEPGDIIVRLGRYQVRTLDDFAALLQMLPDSGRVAVIRGDRMGEGILQL